MKISAADVKKLRDTTGAGMMDAKKALTEAEGDFEKAIEVLRKKGQKVAAKRADRDSFEGAVIAATSSDNKKGAVVSLKCETDFVAKNEDFVTLATKIAEFSLDFGSKEELLKAEFEGKSLEETLVEKTGVIGEKIEIGNFETLEGEFIGSYIHANNKIAALVGISEAIAEGAEVTKNVSMQVAAMSPAGLNEDEIDPAIVEKEMEIAKDQLRQEGKPEEMLDKIAKGKLNKFYKENTLVHQAYIKAENKENVQQYVASFGKDLKVTGFKRVAI